MGCSASETGGALTQDPETVTGYTLTGCVRSMFSNRLSFTFDLRGFGELNYLLEINLLITSKMRICW